MDGRSVVGDGWEEEYVVGLARAENYNGVGRGPDLSVTSQPEAHGHFASRVIVESALV